MLLNYADRGSLSIAAPALKDSLGIDNAQMGLVLSAFFWSYALAQPVAGWVTQRFPLRMVMATGVVLWSLATIACGFATSLATLFALRLLLGIGESVIFPVNACLFAQAPEHQRGRANGISGVGAYIGPAVGTLAGGAILALWGWPSVFWVLGGITLSWIVPWLIDSGRLLGDCAQPRTDPVPYPSLLRQRSLWGASIGQFCYSYQFYFILTWLPLYLVKAAHFSIARMTLIGVVLYTAQAATAALAGFVGDALIVRGHAPSLVRKGFLVGGLCITGLCLLLAGPFPSLAPVLLVVAGAGMGCTGPMVFAIGQSLAGPRAGGRWMGIQNMIGNFSGIAAPIATGLVVDATGSFAGAFALAAAMSVAGIGCWLLGVGGVRAIRWQSPMVSA